MQYDVFICHASEDKDDFVRPLAKLLDQQHIDVWYDEFSLKVGDSLSQKIDEGLLKSRFGIVVLSNNFFSKPWTKRELSGLVTREMLEQRPVILPIWHRVTFEEVASFSLPLADKKAIVSSKGINAVIRELTEKINPDYSPLVVARDFLDNLGLTPPPVTDEWWLDMIEHKEFLKYPDTNSGQRWIFPLPYPDEDRGYQRGMNIANASLQLDWSFEGQELDIGPTTHPDIIHSYLRRWPGLMECARQHPSTLILYAPQLTIPGYDSGFEDIFDEILESDPKEASIFYSFSELSTVDNALPLCADLIALRHPDLGNYTNEEHAYRYFNAHDTRYMRFYGSNFEGLVWLLTDDCAWLPEKIHKALLNGLVKRDVWVNDLDHQNIFFEAIFMYAIDEFEMTPEIEQGLTELIAKALDNLSVSENPGTITKRFLDENIIASYFNYQLELDRYRKSRKGQK